jgi:hypothetical protein
MRVVLKTVNTTKQQTSTLNIPSPHLPGRDVRSSAVCEAAEHDSCSFLGFTRFSQSSFSDVAGTQRISSSSFPLTAICIYGSCRLPKQNVVLLMDLGPIVVGPPMQAKTATVLVQIIYRNF